MGVVNVSNGVRQGGIISPDLFSRYLDGFLCTSMGCWKSWQIGVLVVFGVHCLWVLWSMQMMLCCWHLMPLLSGVC